ncbi:NLR family CARD domain-containing protein 3-like [Triplophysa dalaica]|uniref:NLR family CARD domain-containing protein 3-like n=1 Tax=Triplophysa dalaica TaxID=1582913 RepID=UPI0024DF3AF2|nr:NLR family CARD domain-containing protein 3-like [Triplophysa dalaica]
MDEAETIKDGDLFARSRPKSPVASCLSMNTNSSIDHLTYLDDKMTAENSKQVRSVSLIQSTVSMKSDASIERPPNINGEMPPGGKSDFGDIMGSMEYSRSPSTEKWRNMVTSQPSTCESEPAVLEKFKSNMKVKFQCLREGTAHQGNPTLLLNDIFTKVYITEDSGGEINNEHEIRQIEAASRRTSTEDRPINCNDIFKPSSELDKPIRTVMTKGVAGIGKTVSVQKFILDWTEAKENQDIGLIFPLPFRELNLMKNKTLSLLDLLHLFFPETKELEISGDKYKVLFILDGLDECRLSLDFHSSVRLCDVEKSASMDVMLTNLIAGNLLPSALLWITSRPAAADLIPSERVHRVTEVRGFSDPQKEEYFRKRISNPILSNKIISHLKSSRSLYIMCHIPVFCWISATVLERMLSEAEPEEIPKTLTQMYTHFLIIQTNIKHQKDYEKKGEDEEMILKLGKLAFEQLEIGNLIFYEEDLMECGIDVAEASVYSGLCTQIFREEFGLYLRNTYCFVHLTMQEHLAALYVYLTFINKNTNVFDRNTTASSDLSDMLLIAVDKTLDSDNGHLDLFLRFLLGLSLTSNQALLRLLTQTEISFQCTDKTAEYIKHKIMENPSPERSINLFHCLNELGDHSLVKEVQYFLTSGSIRGTKLSASQWSAVAFVLLTSEQMDVFHMSKYARMCSDIDEVLERLLPVIEASRTAHLHYCILSAKCCSALASALSSKISCLRELNLNGNGLHDEGATDISCGLESLHCRLEILKLANCKLTDRSCAALASALKSKSSSLKELNLSWNNLQDDGVNLLAAGLEDSHCKLEILKLRKCGFTESGCAALASALNSNPSHMRELHLNRNDLGDRGISGALENPLCKLEILCMVRCGITAEGCGALASALRSNPSHLRQLNLSENQFGDAGLTQISAWWMSPDCKLVSLRLMYCGITHEGCGALASALRVNPSHLSMGAAPLHLRHLNLSGNILGDSGVKLLFAGPVNLHCKLEILKLMYCGVADEGCAALASVMKSNTTDLKELYLDKNELGDSGVELLSAALENPHCKLELLKLWDCGITDKGCVALASALTSNPSHLRNLYVFGNNLGLSGVNPLSALVDDPHNSLETFDLY